VAILVVRHAKAGDRDRWEGPDQVRPLTRSGREQAEGLVAALAGFDVGRVLSSPYARCVETVVPLAVACDVAVEPCEDLAEGAGAAAVALITTLAATPGRDDGQRATVLCTHGDVVLDILDSLADAGVELPDELALRKGSTWVLAVEGGRVVGARYLDPPTSG
jgi:8-oxo-dGTP diphosphatase